MKPRGIIFDMDDTLFATAGHWKRAESELLERLGSAWSQELALRYKGMNAPDVAATIHAHLRPALSLEECRRLLRNALEKAVETEPPRPMQGAIECLGRLAGTAPLALASGSPLAVIEAVLGHYDLKKYFQVCLSSESVPRGKPAPDVFLEAAARLGVTPEASLVFEDSLVGVRAAKAAGMACFAIPSTPGDGFAALADRVFTSLQEVTLADLDFPGPA